MERLVAQGKWGTVEWAINSRNVAPAQEYYQGLSPERKAKLLVLFQNLAQRGVIRNVQKFKNLGHRAKGKGAELWEFKSGEDRLLGDFRPGGRFLIAHGLSKKKDDLPKPDIEKAVRILEEHDYNEQQQRRTDCSKNTH